ncbi:MAG: histidine kinase [Bacteroidetes bacterium HGW-Bacteroidetes-1]|jgi:CheY-like chemotaxis protein/signal transduction histidine kinase/HAMP domain-containing protein|nr:MAG: histidine kinase [Bacteroidetes bacterium HGW-Bacteroidetes-1]
MDNLDYNKATTWEKLKFSLKSWRYIGVGKSLLIWFLAISIIPLASISFINFLNAYQGLTIVAEKSLNTTSQLRTEYINTFFDEINDFLEQNSQQKADIEFLIGLKEGYKKHDSNFTAFVKSDDYQELTSEHLDEFKNLTNKNGYYNICYLDNKGTILFSLKQESDLGSNLFTGDLRLTKFGQTVRKVIESRKPAFSDIEFYEPSFNVLSGFFIHPVLDSVGQLTGVIALQITMDRLNQIIKQEAGYGETGQAYIVGKDQLLRSSMRFGNESDIMIKKIENQKIKDWLFFLQHRNDSKLLKEKELDEEKVSTYDSDLNGKYVLGIYRNLDLVEKLGVNWVLIEEIEHSEAFAYARTLSDIVKLTFLLTIIIVFFTSILVTRWFVNPIKQLSSWAKEVGEGQLDNKRIKAPNNEVGEMVSTFNRLVNALQKYANVAKLMAKGDYTEMAEIRSENDVLGKSMNQMVESFKQVVEQANRVAEGDYSVNVVPRSEKDTLNIALFEMTKKLNQNAIENKNQDWLKTGINKLDAEMSGNDTLEKIAEKIIQFITPYVDAQIGLIYVFNSNKSQLDHFASYGIANDDLSIQKNFSLGEGVVGQVAKTKSSIQLLQKSGNPLSIKLGSGKLEAQEFFVFPLIHEGELIGVIELALLNPLSETAKNYLALTAVNIAIALRTAKAVEKVRELLKQTQEQANELAVQQEELSQANEELQEQTAALRVSEENLQAQQEELKVTNEELEERTHALEVQRDAIKQKNTELEAARKEIEQKAKDLELASRYKSEFLANMSHELRTPLNSILVLSQLLAENKKNHFDGKELEYARTINSSGTDLLDLINEILDLSKVESGKIDLFIEALYLDDIAVFIKKNFGPVAEKKGLELFINIEKSLPEIIRTDNQRVFQILKNLYSNALKFTHKGSITLNIFRPETEPNAKNQSKKYIGLAVSDTGIGIPEDKLQLIFEAFKQADGTTSRKYGGTGLGLSISKAFTELLGGFIKVDSVEDQGTTFTLFLPEDFEQSLNKEKEDNSLNPVVKENAADQSKRTIKSKESVVEKAIQTQDGLFKTDLIEEAIDDRNSITEGERVLLVIEDDPNFAHLLYDLAHEHRFKCLIANDGEAGLHLADFYLPSAIILDIVLPGIDGYEVMDRLKKNNRTRHIPVHFVSAADKTLDALKQGAIGYLHKPVSKESLESAFNKIEDIVSNSARKLLVVEDDDITRKSIVNLMQEDGVIISAVDSGEAAYELIKTDTFDCLILDLGLKEMSGFELLELIKKDDKLNTLPVVVYTAHELTKEEDIKLQRYADSIILKGARSFERLLSETTLFLHQVESKLPAKKQEILKKLHQREDVLSGKTILIVDDDMRNVFALTSFLENYNIKLVIGKNGIEGIEKLHENPQIDLVLMDIMMPEMNGYEAMREIRKESKYQKLPIIALTAKAMKDDRDKCIAAGANEYLTKPFDTDKLLSLLRVWLYN